MKIPEDYVISVFYRYNGNASRSGPRNHYGSCCICKEGKSWGKRKRCYYMPDKDHVFCHNCGHSSNGLSWVMQVTNMSFKQVMEELKDYDILPEGYEEKKEVKKNPYSLPYDCINLNDPIQMGFYQHNPVIKKIKQFLKKRRMDTAVNRPDNYWVTLKDRTHKNRLIIPFYDMSEQIIWYQSRAVLPDDEELVGRYLSKGNSDRSLYGVNKVNPFYDHVFIFEGPIDAFFVKNSLALGGVVEEGTFLLTDTQKEQMEAFTYQEKVWVLDNQWWDKAAYLKSVELIKQGESVFIWPESCKQFKDFNDIAVRTKKDEIKKPFILANTFKGQEAKDKFNKVKKLWLRDQKV